MARTAWRRKFEPSRSWGRRAHRLGAAQGRAFKQECLPFGEVVLYLPAGAALGFEPRWRQGIWLGIATNSGENKIFDTAGGHYAQARSVKRIPREDRDMTA